MIGKTVSHYRILRPLGAGGMGVVYAGEDVRLGRPVALKFVPEELGQDHQAVDRLMGEARTASNLNHPNICTIYDIGEYEGQPFIVMELLEGRTLRERLAIGPMKPHDAVDLGIHVADALDAAHRRNIIHRDIKPANLFLVDRGPVKILDFGLAKLVARAQDNAMTTALTMDRTAAGVTLGTVAYMSPEQVTGEELDGRSDLFSLGVVLYEALTGQQPFSGKTSAVIFSAILTRAPVAPVTFNPDLPLRLQEIVNNCLEKDRELRYQDAAGLRADLKRIKRDLESGRSGVFNTTEPVSVAHQAPTAAVSIPQISSPHAQTGVQGAQPAAVASRQPPYMVIGAAVVLLGLLAVGAYELHSHHTAPSQATDIGSSSSPTSVRTQLALAGASVDSKDYQRALTYAEEVLRTAPGDRDAIRIRDTAHTMLTRFDEAVGTVRQLMAAGDVDGASTALERARDIEPTAPAVTELSTRLAAQRQARESRLAAPAANAAPAVKATGPVVPPAGRRAAVEPPPSAGRTQAPPSAAAAPPASQPSVEARVQQPPPAAEAPKPVVSTAPPVAPPVATAAPAPLPQPAPPPAAVDRRETSTAPPAAAAPARAAESDDAAIRRVVATYARAIETKDFALFKTVKPNVSADEQRRIEEGFRAVTSQQVNTTIVGIDQKGTDASVRISRRDTIVAAGRKQTTESMQTMTLTRSGAGWVIREIGR